jgi:DNA recombination protein RmuC
METTAILIIILLVLNALVFFIVWRRKPSAASSAMIDRNLYDELKIELQKKEEALIVATSELAKIRERNAILTEEVEKIQETFRLEFKNMANELLEEKSKKFTELNEKNIGNILQPLKERIQGFEKKVEETYNQETREKASLRKELEHMMKLNQQVSEDATRLTNALKGDSKIQGDWGEVQLELLLEKVGLIKDVHYRKQENFKTEDGKNVRPDYVINLPDDKHYVIDSKVSLTAYENCFNAEDESAKNKYMQEHVASLNRHIVDLSSKNYQQLYGINSLDYVFLFVPLEAALTFALREDNTLFEKALNKNIVLVSPSTLLATLRTVSFVWRQENQKRNVLEIAKEGGALYDKFVSFMEDLIGVGKRLQDTKKEYDGAMNKLFDSPKKGDTIIGRVQRLKDMGAKATKQLPQSLIDRAAESEQLKIDG